jgi:hypothetical protein
MDICLLIATVINAVCATITAAVTIRQYLKAK